MNQQPGQRRSGLIAILRGIHPHESVEVATAIVEAGIRIIEVPLNSPEPLDSIERMRAALGDACTVGAGTVLDAASVQAVRDAGAQIVVSPNTDPAVIAATIANGLGSYPGAATPTEAFAAIAAGATSVKLFPGEAIGPAGLRAWRAVVPAHVELLPVGGVGVESIADWVRAGATGAGIGSSLYRPGAQPADVHRTALALVDAWRVAHDEAPTRP